MTNSSKTVTNFFRARNTNDIRQTKLRIYQRLILNFIAFFRSVLYNHGLNKLFMMLRNVYGAELKMRTIMIVEMVY